MNKKSLNFERKEETAYNKHRVQFLKRWKIHMDVCTGFWGHYLNQQQQKVNIANCREHVGSVFKVQNIFFFKELPPRLGHWQHFA